VSNDLCTVVTRNRTVFLNKNLSLKEVIEKTNDMGLKLSLRRTLQYYGLRYVEDRSFISRYREEFNLLNRSMYDITLHELLVYKETLIYRKAFK